ncbi:MAG: hypothetical protein PHV25_01140 [Candidatus Pacebacteria bacterium]|nr:hypothetical protein [Candidatus Paceibacterota bacterium]
MTREKRPLGWKTKSIPLMGAEPTPKDPEFRKKLFSGEYYKKGHTKK